MVDDEIVKDMHRTERVNVQLDDPQSAEYRHLWNVCNAYAHYDQETGYPQSLNFIANWLLKHTQKARYDDAKDEVIFEYDEAATFYVVVHIFQRLAWRYIYHPPLDYLMKILELIEENMQHSAKHVYDWLKEVIDDTNLYPIFASFVLSIFISDLQESHPETLRTIFDAFLIDGASVIYTLLFEFIEMK